MKDFCDMTEPEMIDAANAIKSKLPAGTLFVLVTFEPDMIGQYISNAERNGIIKSMREFADRLQAREDVTR